jgi:phenol 2-monooxygenase
MNAHTIPLQTRIRADGRWRLIIFPGDIRAEARLTALRKLADELESPTSFVRRYTPANAGRDAVIETFTVFASPHTAVQAVQLSFPESLVPRRAPHGVRAFDTLFSDEPSYHDGDGKAYEAYGVDPAVGAVVVARPDQHVAGVFALDDYKGLDRFFSGFMIEQNK